MKVTWIGQSTLNTQPIRFFLDSVECLHPRSLSSARLVGHGAHDQLIQLLISIPTRLNTVISSGVFGVEKSHPNYCTVFLTEWIILP